MKNKAHDNRSRYELLGVTITIQGVDIKFDTDLDSRTVYTHALQLSNFDKYELFTYAHI